jgi:hypothetical protein
MHFGGVMDFKKWAEIALISLITTAIVFRITPVRAIVANGA